MQADTPSSFAYGTTAFPAAKHAVRALLLGSGELGKEIAIRLMRLGVRVIASDSYEGAPAQQIANASCVVDMADPQELNTLISKVRPTIIIPEVEAIATSQLTLAANQGIRVVPASVITQICMDRKRLRIVAHEDAGLPTTPYRFAANREEFTQAVNDIGFPCVVKPIMSSSGHGQSIVHGTSQLDAAWEHAQHGGRAATHGTPSEVIVERLANIAYELTVLTVCSSSGVVVCEPIGQRQEHGDYRESWQPAAIPNTVRECAITMASTMVTHLAALAADNHETGWGVYGVELFVLKDGSVLFNEVSPRPHDTGMVTMESQRFDEFDLHVHAMLGAPVTPEHVRMRNPEHAAASHPLVVSGDGRAVFTGVEQALADPQVDIRIFGKPVVHGSRRMGVVLATGDTVDEARKRANHTADKLTVTIEP